MPEEKRPLKVFLSYASQDRPAVRELYQRLKTEGWIDPWLDVENLKFGQHWTSVIEDALDAADVVLIFLSHNSVQKEDFIQRELNYAWELSLEKPRNVIFLIPFRLDDCEVPRYLRSRQWGDYFGEKKEITYQTLLRSLQERHQQKLRLEAEERAQAEALARTQAEENARQEKTRQEREAAEKAAQEKVEREAAEKVAREKAEREAVDKVLREKEEREAFEKKERNATRKAALARTLTQQFIALKSILLQATPILRIAGIIGIILILFGIGSWAVPRFNSLISTGKTTATRSPAPQMTSTRFVVAPTSTGQPSTVENLKVAFVLDTSGIMAIGQTFRTMLEATSSSISEFKDNEELTVFSFNETVNQDVSVTNDFNSASEQVQAIQAVPRSNTCLYDAVYEIFQDVSAFDDLNWVIVVIADGRDQNLQGEICSKVKANDVVTKLVERQNPNPVYIITLGNYYIQEDILQSISKLTGGSYIQADSNQLATILPDLFKQLRISPSHQYSFKAIESPTPTSTTTPIPTPISVPTKITDNFDVEMMLIPAGEFMMGSENGNSDEQPVHAVNLDAFYMDKFEVTNVLYKVCVDKGVCKAPFQSNLYSLSKHYNSRPYDDYPVIYVNWSMAKTYCEWRGAKLPSEAQWEKAARGTDGWTYPWGEGIDCEKANYGGCEGNLTKVGSYEDGKSPYGLYDMAGNVMEWVEDQYVVYPGGDPNASTNFGGDYRVLRGGSWINLENELSTSHRYSAAPLSISNYRGFRCAKDATP